MHLANDIRRVAEMSDSQFSQLANFPGGSATAEEFCPGTFAKTGTDSKEIQPSKTATSKPGKRMRPGRRPLDLGSSSRERPSRGPVSNHSPPTLKFRKFACRWRSASSSVASHPDRRRLMSRPLRSLMKQNLGVCPQTRVQIPQQRARPRQGLETIAPSRTSPTESLPGNLPLPVSVPAALASNPLTWQCGKPGKQISNPHLFRLTIDVGFLLTTVWVPLGLPPN